MNATTQPTAEQIRHTLREMVARVGSAANWAATTNGRNARTNTELISADLAEIREQIRTLARLTGVEY